MTSPQKILLTLLYLLTALSRVSFFRS